jgi:hypothetical protein
MLAPFSPRDMDKLEVMGRFNSMFLFPQYLQRAMFEGANAKAEFCSVLLDASWCFLGRIFLTMSVFFIITPHPNLPPRFAGGRGKSIILRVM